MESYFKETDAFIKGNAALRGPQRVAHAKLKHSLAREPNIHKIIVLPTGAGKTGLIAIAPYQISDGRVLVITPSLVIREGISDAFDTRTPFNFWTERNVIIDDNKLPNVYRYAGYKTSADKTRVMRYLNEANIVIANIHKTFSSRSDKSLCGILPSDFFDMIIIDEAHHSAADSWIQALEHFSAKKIVKLTATPFRADAKELDGDLIFSDYQLADAIKDKLVKNILAEDYTTEKLEFLVDGKLVDKETALDAMDKKWVTRSVAYSPKCNQTIVEMSIKRLLEKRRLGSAHHQIIAVACDINHAKDIKALYEAQGLTAAVVTSDEPDKAEDTIIDYKKGQIDVVVNVNMLGEGFDHPNISIAAIFRPFRTLSPYAQFIGRALRKIKDGDDNIDNLAHVVYHTELDLDELWAYYPGQKIKGERKKIIELEYYREQASERNTDIGEVNAEGKVIGNIKEFLSDGIAARHSEEIQKRIDEREEKINKVADMMRTEGFSELDVEDYIKSQKQQLDKEITDKRNKLREELIREELHKVHTEDIVNRVDILFEETGIDPKGIELPSNTTSSFLKSAETNDAYIMKYINNSLKQKLKRSINEWETYDFEQAKKLLPELIERLKQKIQSLGA
ncbi:DEAD/DEAH box helicase [Aneurinibacillus tyrosinisolvens]|uniref:DEAD/DEAH box helicase n=1 Tax=Aneurinibacillus tyrosinisolvens TaxID=1443435 RepID=UPI00069CA8ED|nr:DEAD/DEAH box helicase family protein [Aneurinibacillus tyrosinisolvens]